MEEISWSDFMKVELRVGRVLQAEVFPEARKPAYKLMVDFGPELGQRKSSAQITAHYQPEELVGRLVVAVVNFPKKQIGPLMSECLVTGFHDADCAVKPRRRRGGCHNSFTISCGLRAVRLEPVEGFVERLWLLSR